VDDDTDMDGIQVRNFIEATWITDSSNLYSHWEITRVDERLQPSDAVFVILMKDMEDEDDLWLTSGVNIVTKLHGIWESHALLSLAPTDSGVEVVEDSTYWVNIDLLDLSSFFEQDSSIPIHNRTIPKPYYFLQDVPLSHVLSYHHLT